MHNKYQHRDFKEFYNEYFHRVFLFLKNRTQQTEDAKDLTHDVFLKAFQHFNKIQTADKIDSYLFTISRNVLADYYKDSLANQHMVLGLENNAHTVESAEPLDDTASARIQQLHKSIESLPDQRKEIIKRKKLLGHSTEEIAEELQLSKRTVENQIYRAMLTLRKQLTHILSSLL